MKDRRKGIGPFAAVFDVDVEIIMVISFFVPYFILISNLIILSRIIEKEYKEHIFINWCYVQHFLHPDIRFTG